MNKLQCRLINPAKNPIGHISKTILDNIISKVKEETSLNLWKNTDDVINWFTTSPGKEKSKFIKFDICEFYPSIIEELLKKALNYAKTFVDISDEDEEIILHYKRSLLFHNNEVWTKMNYDKNFDVTMGSLNGAETCEIVGLFILNMLKSEISQDNLGLYRDDGLAIIKNANGHTLDNLRKRIIRIFKNEGLKITIEINLSSTEFLNVTLDLRNNKYYPCRKPNDNPVYVNMKSNHPPTILKQMPSMVSTRLSKPSCSEEEFHKSKPFYEDMLKLSGYSEGLVYKPNASKPTKRKRQRNIIRYNPPFSLSVRTNIGRRFLSLIKKHFSKHKYQKIFNSNTIKLSYSCMPNIGNTIRSHNKKVTENHDNETNKKDIKRCSCKSTSTCPLNGNCLQTSIVYLATVSTDQNTYKYTGLTENSFKQRFTTHNQSFRHEKYSNATELSKLIWTLKKSNTNYKVTWQVLQSAIPYKICGTRCDLCLSEKLHIINAKDRIINKKTELISKCRHKNKFTLKSLK